MEITIAYQDRTITLTRPETKYGSNIESFNELAHLALAGVGLVLNGSISEIENETK